MKLSPEKVGASGEPVPVVGGGSGAAGGVVGSSGVAAGGVGHAPVDRPVEDPVGNLADADHASGHHRAGPPTTLKGGDHAVAWVESDHQAD